MMNYEGFRRINLRIYIIDKRSLQSTGDFDGVQRGNYFGKVKGNDGVTREMVKGGGLDLKAV